MPTFKALHFRGSRFSAVVPALVLAALTPVVFSTPANAARAPKKSELKWILKEFKADKQDKGAVVSFVSVSTVDPDWADVQYFPKPKGSATTGGRVAVCAASRAGAHASGCCGTCGGAKAKDRMVKKGSGAGKPPKPARKDLAKPFLVHVNLNIKHGTETGTSTYNYAECGTIKRAMNVTFHGGLEFDFDLRKEESIQYRPAGYSTAFANDKLLNVKSVPGVSAISYKYENNTQTDSNGKHCAGLPPDQCFESAGRPDEDNLILFQLYQWSRTYSGSSAAMDPLFATNCRANGQITPRVYGYDGGMQLKAPVLRLGSGMLDLGEHPIDYTEDSYRHEPGTVHTTDWCAEFDHFAAGDSGSCSDTIDWAGFLTISVPNNERP